MPQTAEKIIKEEVAHKEVMNEKENGRFHERGIKQDSLNYHYEIIKSCDAVLATNFEKKSIKGYIGGATFLEMGFAHILGKKIFPLNKIPKISYTDEIKMMQPIVLNGDLTKNKIIFHFTLSFFLPELLCRFLKNFLTSKQANYQLQFEISMASNSKQAGILIF